MHKYCRVLYQNCVIESIFAIVSGIVQFKIETIGSTFITFGGIRPWSQTSSNVIATLYVYAFHTLLLSVSVQFFYRYLILVKKHNIRNWLYMTMLVPPLGASTFNSAVFYWAVDSMPPCSKNSNALFLEIGQNYVPCVQFDINLINGKLALLCATITTTTFAIIIIVLNIVVYQHVSENAAFTTHENAMVIGIFGICVFIVAGSQSCFYYTYDQIVSEKGFI
uniref:Serpentine receptor class gamma n=1 Tax=Panagrellus redivivus TaxID=6233 RepID=A0A7E4W3V6_PANRE